jgi:GntR family transcriptional regulator, transcriptional repressor for pyruvate dehydrogenase complex
MAETENQRTVARRGSILDGRPSYTVLSAPRQIAAAIKREILEGSLKPGDRLPSESRMAEIFGVSRPTVRAALQELSSAGTVVVQRGRGGGYRVSAFSLDNLQTTVTEFIAISLVVEALAPQQFMEVRRELELLSAEAAARRRTDAHLERLADIEQRVETAVEDPREDPRHSFELDLEFHRLLADAADNPLIMGFEGAMTAVLHYLFGSGVSVPPEEALGGIIEVIEAVRNEEPAAARDAMARHLEHSVRHVKLRLPAEQARPAL